MTNKLQEAKNIAISDFSKSKIFETMVAVEECVDSFFAVFAVENEFLEISELLRKNSIAIPDGVLNKIERFVNQDLNNLVYNPDKIFSQLPDQSNTIESIRARNGKLTEIYEKFVKERLNPLKADVKRFIVNS